MATIGEAARMSGVGIEAIRFYERTGVLPPAPRTAAGRRVYDRHAVERLAFVKQCRAFGFSLSQAGRMAQAAPSDCAAVATLAQARLRSLRAHIAQMQALEQRLSALASGCAPDRKACPVLSGMTGDGC